MRHVVQIAGPTNIDEWTGFQWTCSCGATSEWLVEYVDAEADAFEHCVTALGGKREDK